MPTISIIVPVYKVEPYLRRCVDSVLAQTFTDFDLILVNDGSPDNCPAICDEYATKDNRVKVIHKPNGGLSSARNVGLDVATGEYVLFVDSDDWIALETLEKTLAVARENDSDMVIFDYTEVYEDGSAPHRAENSFFKTEQWSKDDFWRHYYGGFGILCVVAWNKLCKRSLFDTLSYELGRILEDEIIIYDLVKKANRITFLNEVFYYYYRRKDSIIGIRSKKSVVDAQYAFLQRAPKMIADGFPQYAACAVSDIIAFLKQCNKSWTMIEKRNLFNAMRDIHKIKLSAIWPYLTSKRKMTVSVLCFSPRLFLFGANMLQKIRKHTHTNS